LQYPRRVSTFDEIERILVMSNDLPNRAITDQQKEVVMFRILAAWKACPTQRLGQLIDNAMFQEHASTSRSRPGLFSIEDTDLALVVENFAGNHSHE
jgi:hypothetical protein